MTVTTFFLLRHAESQPDPHLDESKWLLSKRGEEQADALVEDLGRLGIDRVFSSPYQRALDTVQRFAADSGLEVISVDALRERKLTTSFATDFESLITRAWDDLDFALPDCESGLACQTRMFELVSNLVLEYPGKKLLLSTHGNALALLLNRLDPDYGFDFWRSLRNPDLIKVIHEHGGFRIEGVILQRKYQS